MYTPIDTNPTLRVVLIRLYYQYIPEEKEYPILCRKLAIENTNWVKRVINYTTIRSSNEQILLDWNEIAKEHGKFTVYPFLKS